MKKPYAFINDQMQTYITLKTRLGGNAKFDVLNGHIRNIVVIPGQVVIVGDHSTQVLSAEEKELMTLAQGVRHQLVQNMAGGDGQVVRHYDLLQQILGYSSIGIGAATGSWSKHLDGVKHTLEDIERLHKLSLARGTPIARREFISQRRVLFSKLDTQLEGIARWGTGLRNKGSIKKMLGISTKSYLHTGEIRGYAKTIGGVAKAAHWLKKGTAVGIGLNMMSSGLELDEACSVGREGMCEKAAYVLVPKLAVGLIAGAYVGELGAASGTVVCAAVFGIPSFGLGALGCGIIGGALGAFGGERLGELLYEWRP